MGAGEAVAVEMVAAAAAGIGVVDAGRTVMDVETAASLAMMRA